MTNSVIYYNDILFLICRISQCSISIVCT